MRRLGSLQPRDSAAGRESGKGRETTTGAGSATRRPQLYFHADVSSPAGAFLVMWLAMVRIRFSWVRGKGVGAWKQRVRSTPALRTQRVNAGRSLYHPPVLTRHHHRRRIGP